MATPSNGPKRSADALAETVVSGSAADPTRKTQIPPSPRADGQGPGGKPQAKSQRLGDFEVKKKIGQGGMGVVYLAHQVSLDRPVALKVLSKEIASKPAFVERFVREARAMAKINHPAVVNCYHVGEEKGLHYVAMELVDGRSMQDWLNQLGKLSVPDAVLVTLVCGEALAHAHSLQMVHRDVKPDNILVTRKGVIKVSDLGLAKVLDDEDHSMTQSGTGLGTPHYMPPEQARNAKHIDATCDIYALGVTLYHFVTGALPFSGESVVELILSKERGSYKPARQHNREVSEKLSLMIDKAMARDRKARYQTMAEFIKDLESLNLASESLSFIQGEKALLRRGSGAPTMTGMKTAAAASSRPVPPTSAEDAARSREAVSDGVWFVKHDDGGGQTKVTKMTTAQITQLMKADRLDRKTQAAVSTKAPFLPLAQIPVFAEEAMKLATRQATKARNSDLAAQFAKIDKQYKRQKWWRLLARFRDGTLGLVGLILYLAAIAAVIGGLVYLYLNFGAGIAQKFGLQK
ncbi:Serine/threonine-protein kinase PrkC [Caulifigura coniformis]|uniref:Serine/threonine-protein kinase PrkC n=1 Tax=Caulifigura coniformis TaxID=2527983 RepID=A0A517SEK2_9PLAN|nr:serine/threonine-protein kinase [Caulifigura coniformis]QDT54527.1 Serine/threonine-protein kinase PrkC [Caulifigura coniformis]